jgi:hypothetical protein
VGAEGWLAPALTLWGTGVGDLRRRRPETSMEARVDERLAPDLLRGRGSSIGEDLNVG